MTQALVRAVGVAVRSFYRHEHVGGAVPDDGPLVLVANHPNGLVDPVVLSWTSARPLRFLGKATLFDMPVLGALVRGVGTLPVHRAQDGADTQANERTFAAVYGALEAGDAICLFPEGRSHDEPALQRLKTGAARMALGAEARAGFALGVRVVPVGLVYRAKRRFRSTVATWVGAPIPTADLTELHARDAWAATLELNERIAAGLRRVTLELDAWEDLPLVDLAERIDGGGVRRGPGGRLPRLRAFAEGLRDLRARQPERVEALVHDVAAFRARLRALRLDVRDLDVDYTPRVVARFVLRNLTWLALGLPLALVGTVAFALPYWLARIVGDRIRATPDVYATVHILSGITFHLAYAVALVLGLWAWAGATWALLVALLLLPAGVAALWFHDWRSRVLGDVATFFRLGTRRGLRRALVAERDALAGRIEALRREVEAERARSASA